MSLHRHLYRAVFHFCQATLDAYAISFGIYDVRSLLLLFWLFLLLLLHNRTNYCDVESSEINNFAFRPDQVVVWWLAAISCERASANEKCTPFVRFIAISEKVTKSISIHFIVLVCFPDTFDGCDETKRKLKNKSEANDEYAAFCCTLSVSSQSGVLGAKALSRAHSRLQENAT